MSWADLVWAVVALIAALCVYADGRRLGVQYGGPTGRDSSMGRVGWAVLTFFVPVVFVPLYLWRRRRYLHQVDGR